MSYDDFSEIISGPAKGSQSSAPVPPSIAEYDEQIDAAQSMVDQGLEQYQWGTKGVVNLSNKRDAAVRRESYDEFSDVTGEKPGLKQYAAAFAESAGFEAIRGSGAITGAGIGAKLGAFGGPKGALFGGAIGLFGGAGIADQAARELSLTPAEEQPPELRVSAYPGAVAGGSVLPAAGVYGMARSGFRFGPNPGALEKPSMTAHAVNDMADFANKSAIWKSREAWMVGTSAAGAAAAGYMFPESELWRFTGEIFGPLAHTAAVSAGSGAIRGGMNLYRTMFPKGAESVAGMVLESAFKASDGDPVIFNRIVRDFAKNNPEFASAYLTPAQISDDSAMRNIEKSLAAIDKKFGSRAAESAREGLEAVRTQIGLFSAIGGEGSPEALQVASKMRVKYYEMLNDLVLKSATEDALAAVARISTENPANARQISKAASESLGNAVKQVSDIETMLWNDVENVPVTSLRNMTDYFNENVLRSDIPPEVYNDIPLEARKFLYRMFVRGKDVDVGATSNDLVSVLSRDTAAHTPDPVFRGSETNTNELQKMRSRFLQMARAASRDPEKANSARVYNELAESILDDIDATFAESGTSSAYEAARQFTKAKHDTFTRSFVGEALAEGRYGRRIDPEILLRKAMASGKEVTTLRMAELEQATRFLDTQGYGDDNSYRVMVDAQDRMIRLMAIDAYDPYKETISVPKLKTFLGKYNDLLTERFPGVKREIEQAIQFSTHREDLASMIKGDEINRNKNMLSRIYRMGADPVETSARILRSPSRSDKLTAALNELKRGLDGEIIDKVTGKTRNMTSLEKRAAMDGFSTSVFEAAMYQSMNNVTEGGQVSMVLQPQKFRSILFEPATAGQKPIMDIMVEQKMITQEVASKIKRILDVSTNIQNYDKVKPIDMENQFSTELNILASRLFGSGVVGWAARKIHMGSSIIVHGAAARYSQNVATKLPQGKIINVLVDAFSDSTNDYEKLRLLTNRTNDPLRAIENSRQMHAWFIRMGYMTTNETATEMKNMMFSLHDETIKHLEDTRPQWNQPLEETSTLQ